MTSLELKIPDHAVVVPGDESRRVACAWNSAIRVSYHVKINKTFALHRA